jgi:hypothetical protein
MNITIIRADGSVVDFMTTGEPISSDLLGSIVAEVCT